MFFFSSLFYTDPWSVFLTLLTCYYGLHARCVRGVDQPKETSSLPLVTAAAATCLLFWNPATCVAIAALLHAEIGPSMLPETQAAGVIFVVGLSSLLFRQTNVFWVVVYLGGLKTIAVIKTHARAGSKSPNSCSISETVIHSYRTGQILDPVIQKASTEDALKLCLSLPFAALKDARPLFVALLPFLSILCLFATFVIWNGGVVLGSSPQVVLLVAWIRR